MSEHEHHLESSGGRRGRGWPRRRLSTLLLFFFGLWLVGWLLIPSTPRTITVTGSGSALSTPDTANFTIGVSSTASTSAAALTRNNDEMTKLVAALSAAGISAKDRQTSGLSVNAVTNGAGQTTGYNVTDTLSVTTHQLSRLGQTISAALAPLGNDAQFNGVSFSTTQNSQGANSARRDAMSNAMSIASALLRGTGNHLGKVLAITDSPSTPSPVFSAMSQKSAVGVPISPGSTTFTDTVQVTYAIN
jgi:uncharacterized protein